MVKRRIQIFLVILLILFTNIIKAQEEEQQPQVKWKLSDKIFFGGNFGLQFGTITAIEVSPIMGYRFTDALSAGIGVSYEYYSDSRYDYSTSIYGGCVFAQYAIIKQAFIHTEALFLNYEDLMSKVIYKESKRVWDSEILVGGGYRQHISERASINYMILWNLNETKNSLNRNPIIRIGFIF